MRLPALFREIILSLSVSTRFWLDSRHCLLFPFMGYTRYLLWVYMQTVINLVKTLNYTVKLHIAKNVLSLEKC